MNHIALAHSLWQELLQPADTAIDATCGNGNDTLFLAPLVEKLYAIDIQEEAIAKAKAKCAGYTNITFIHGSHAHLPHCSPALIVYNLGYLPGGDKTLTTLTSTTLQSLESAKALQPKMISITLYPGHPEGLIESETLISSVHPGWKVQLHTPGKSPHAPKLLVMVNSSI